MPRMPVARRRRRVRLLSVPLDIPLNIALLSSLLPVRVIRKDVVPILSQRERRGF
jgi:hypothetical protein